jgi:hypothetical protein
MALGLNLPHVRDMGLGQMTDEGVRAVSALPALQTLDLSWCDGVSDDGVRAVGQRLGRSLTCLNLAGCRALTDPAAEAVAALSRLATLNLAGCRLLTDHGTGGGSRWKRCWLAMASEWTLPVAPRRLKAVFHHHPRRCRARGQAGGVDVAGPQRLCVADGRGRSLAAPSAAPHVAAFDLVRGPDGRRAASADPAERAHHAAPLRLRGCHGRGRARGECSHPAHPPPSASSPMSKTTAVGVKQKAGVELNYIFRHGLQKARAPMIPRMQGGGELKSTSSSASSAGECGRADGVVNVLETVGTC